MCLAWKSGVCSACAYESAFSAAYAMMPNSGMELNMIASTLRRTRRKSVVRARVYSWSATLFGGADPDGPCAVGGRSHSSSYGVHQSAGLPRDCTVSL